MCRAISRVQVSDDIKPLVGRLFRAISRAEQAHASGHFRDMRDVVGDAPEHCPVCAAAQKAYVAFA